MNKKLEVKNFDLKKVKLATKGLAVDWFDLTQKNELYNVESDSQPNEDLVDAIKSLGEVFAYSLGLNEGWDFAREHNRKNNEDLKKAINFWGDEIDRCNVSGIVVSGDGASKGIKITGSLSTELGVVGLTSPVIRFDTVLTNCNDEEIKLGETAKAIFEEIQQEVWMFIYKNKRGGELFPAEELESGLRVAN
jgi:hypothetical protein